MNVEYLSTKAKHYGMFQSLLLMMKEAFYGHLLLVISHTEFM